MTSSASLELDTTSPPPQQTTTTTTKNTISVTDNRTGKTIEIPITDESFIDATEFKKLTLSDNDPTGLTLFDAAFMNTAVATSSICYIDGENGVMMYRGNKIEDLARHSNFLEVSYLLI